MKDTRAGWTGRDYMCDKWLQCPFCGKELLKFGRDVRNGKIVDVRIHPRARSCTRCKYRSECNGSSTNHSFYFPKDAD